MQGCKSGLFFSVSVAQVVEAEGRRARGATWSIIVLQVEGLPASVTRRPSHPLHLNDFHVCTLRGRIRYMAMAACMAMLVTQSCPLYLGFCRARSPRTALSSPRSHQLSSVVCRYGSSPVPEARPGRRPVALRSCLRPPALLPLAISLAFLSLKPFLIPSWLSPPSLPLPLPLLGSLRSSEPLPLLPRGFLLSICILSLTHFICFICLFAHFHRGENDLEMGVISRMSHTPMA